MSATFAVLFLAGVVIAHGALAFHVIERSWAREPLGPTATFFLVLALVSSVGDEGTLVARFLLGVR